MKSVPTRPRFARPPSPPGRDDANCDATPHAVLNVDQHAGVEQSLRVERLFRGAQRLGEERRALPVIPGTMVAPDRMVMRDGAAVVDHGVERTRLDREPLLRKLSVFAERME